jgi:hypothetical protein
MVYLRSSVRIVTVTHRNLAYSNKENLASPLRGERLKAQHPAVQVSTSVRNATRSLKVEIRLSSIQVTPYGDIVDFRGAKMYWYQ